MEKEREREEKDMWYLDRLCVLNTDDRTLEHLTAALSQVFLVKYRT